MKPNMQKSNVYDIPEFPTDSLPEYYLQDRIQDVDKIVNDIKANIFWLDVLSLKYKSGESIIERPENMGAKEWFDVVMSKTPKADHQMIINQLVENSYSKAASIADNLESKFNRAFLKTLGIINSHAMYKSQGEFSTMEEYAADRFPRLDPDGGEYSEVMFLMNKLFPMLNAFDPKNAENILKKKDMYGKVRASVSFAREADKTFDESMTSAKARVNAIVEMKEEVTKTFNRMKYTDPDYGKKKEEVAFLDKKVKEVEKEADAQIREAENILRKKIGKIVEVLVDSTVTANGVNGVRNVLKRDDNKHVNFKAQKAIGPNSVTYLIKVPTIYGISVERALTFITFNTTDPKKFAEELEEMLKKLSKK